MKSLHILRATAMPLVLILGLSVFHAGHVGASRSLVGNYPSPLCAVSQPEIENDNVQRKTVIIDFEICDNNQNNISNPNDKLQAPVIYIDSHPVTQFTFKFVYGAPSPVTRAFVPAHFEVTFLVPHWSKGWHTLQLNISNPAQTVYTWYSTPFLSQIAW